MEIFEGLNEKGLAILNGDDKLLYGLNNLLKFRTVFYGMEEGWICGHTMWNLWGKRLHF